MFKLEIFQAGCVTRNTASKIKNGHFEECEVCALFRGYNLPNGQQLSNHEILFALKLNIALNGPIKSFVECALES